jgi:hypothetical protein
MGGTVLAEKMGLGVCQSGKYCETKGEDQKAHQVCIEKK